MTQNEHDIMKEIFSILSTADAWRFNDIVDELRERRKRAKAPSASRTTVSRTLKEFVPLGLVQHDVVTRRWGLSQLGFWFARSGQVVSEKLKRKLEISGPFKEFVQADSDTVMNNLVINFVRVLNTGPKPAPPNVVDQIRSQLLQFGEGRKDAIAMVWMSEAMNLLRELSSLLAAILLFRSSLYPPNAEDVARDNIRRIVGRWVDLRTPLLAERLANYLSSSDFLTAMNKAIGDGKISEDLAEIPFDELRRKLKRLRYLPT